MKKRHIVLALLASLSVILFLDRICIAVAGPRMQDELGIPPDRWGWILGAFVLAYGIFEIPTGAMGDRGGQRSVVTRIVLWWSAFTCLTGAVSGFVPLLAVRFLFGAGEAGAYPNASGSIARWFPPGERARAQGWVLGAGRLGGALTPLLVVPIQAAFGWRASFFVFGAVGILWALVWHRWYRDTPALDPGITAKERAEIGAGETAPLHAAIPWRVLFGSRRLWLIVAMYTCYAWAPWFYFSWMHTYLVKGRGFSEAQMGALSSLPFILSALCTLAGGRLSDHLALRMPRGRCVLGTVCLAASALCLMATAVVPGRIAAVAFLTLGFGVVDLMLASAWAVCLDVGARFAGAVTGAMNTGAQAGGFACAVIFGYIVKATGDYNMPLFAIAGALLLGAALFALIDPRKPIV